MSLGLITTTARLGFPLVFVIGDDWLCYGGWADAWLRWCSERPEQAAVVEQHTGLPTRLPDLGALGIFCFVSTWTKRRAEQVGGWHFPRVQIIFPGLSPSEFPPLVEGPDRPWQGRLLRVGRVIKEKGIETAIHALSLLSPHATLEVVGMVGPPYQHHLEALAATLGSHLNFPSHWRLGSRYANAISKPMLPLYEHDGTRGLWTGAPGSDGERLSCNYHGDRRIERVLPRWPQLPPHSSWRSYGSGMYRAAPGTAPGPASVPGGRWTPYREGMHARSSGGRR